MKPTKHKYSDLEKNMLFELGFSQTDMDRIPPNAIYTYAVTRAFTEAKTGKAVESLRRCVIAMDNGFVRNSPEFDALIIL